MIPFSLSLVERPRRNRKSAGVRDLLQETHLLAEHLVPCFFVIEGKNKKEEIVSMPGVYRLSLDLLLEEIKTHMALGIKAIDLFPYIPLDQRDPEGSVAFQRHNLILNAISEIKEVYPSLIVMTDIALDPYTSHGHDGLIDDSGYVLNDVTVEKLAAMSILAAEAGADVVAPSDMMDGRVAFIRKELDRKGFENVLILSYAAKYASSLYGPFRDALDSSPKVGDKKGYQLNPANKREALREALLDEKEGADILLVKPALCYLDVIHEIREKTNLPLAAYHVSGEYSMVMAAAEKGWLNAEKVFKEQFLSIRRAGADFILTYAAKQVLKM